MASARSHQQLGAAAGRSANLVPLRTAAGRTGVPADVENRPGKPRLFCALSAPRRRGCAAGGARTPVMRCRRRQGCWPASEGMQHVFHRLIVKISLASEVLSHHSAHPRQMLLLAGKSHEAQVFLTPCPLHLSQQVLCASCFLQHRP